MKFLRPFFLKAFLCVAPGACVARMRVCNIRAPPVHTLAIRYRISTTTATTTSTATTTKSRGGCLDTGETENATKVNLQF